MLVELAAACTGVRWTVSQLVMQKLVIISRLPVFLLNMNFRDREDCHAIRNPLDMVAHVQPWMLIPIVPLIFFFEGDLVGLLVFGFFPLLSVLFRLRDCRV